MSKITFTVVPYLETGVFVAMWDGPGAGISTQGLGVEELLASNRDAVACCFDKCDVASRVGRLRFT